VRFALEDRRMGLADNWIRHVQDVRNHHREWLETLAPEARIDALCDLNAVEQALNACQTTVVQDAWARGQELNVHAWVYALGNGLLEDLAMTASGPGEVAGAYEQALGKIRGRHR
jgi:carbonic anhydrase